MTTLMDTAVDVGTTKRLSFSVCTLDYAATPLDPESITLQTRNPRGHIQDQTVVRESTGEFYVEIPLPYSGQWWYRWTTSGPQRSKQGSFLVRRSGFDEALVA